MSYSGKIRPNFVGSGAIRRNDLMKKQATKSEKNSMNKLDSLTPKDL